MTRRPSERWSGGHIEQAYALIVDAGDVARDLSQPTLTCEINLATIHLRPLRESGAQTLQANAPAWFVEKVIGDLEEILVADIPDQVAYRLRNALQHLEALRHCPECGKEVDVEFVVSVVGTGRPKTPRGHVCVQRDTEADGWRLFCHTGGERP